MSPERVIDIIEHVRAFYSQLSVYYRAMSDDADQQRVKLLLDYLSDVEKRHEQVLAEYEENAPSDILNTWFQYGDDSAIPNTYQPTELSSDVDVDFVIQEALRIDQHLSNLYQHAIDRAQTERIKEVFKHLLASNQKEMRNLVRDAGHLHDW